MTTAVQIAEAAEAAIAALMEKTLAQIAALKAQKAAEAANELAKRTADTATEAAIMAAVTKTEKAKAAAEKAADIATEAAVLATVAAKAAKAATDEEDEEKRPSDLPPIPPPLNVTDQSPTEVSPPPPPASVVPSETGDDGEEKTGPAQDDADKARAAIDAAVVRIPIDKFRRYHAIKQQGKFNMADFRIVSRMTHIPVPDVEYISKNYKMLEEQYGSQLRGVSVSAQRGGRSRPRGRP